MTEPYPDSIKKDGPFWFLRHIYRNTTRKNKHFALLMCGESGAGKSWDSLAIAMALYPELRVEESVFFSPTTFLDATQHKHKALFPYIIDDAGLSAFSGDALTSQVKNLSKIAQSIRHTNCQLIFNLPNIDLLAKSVRITNHYYAEPLWIDYTNKLSYIKFQRIRIHKDKISFRNIKTWEKKFNNITGYYQVSPRKHLTYPIPCPPKQITDNYENLKIKFMENYRTETAETMRVAKARELGRDSSKTIRAADEIRNCIDQYSNSRGNADVGKIMHDFGVGESAARFAFRMAMLPKDKNAVDNGIKKIEVAKKKGVPWNEFGDLIKQVQ